MPTKAAIVGPGNIGTDLMYKIVERSDSIEIERMVGILPTEESDGLQAAVEEGIEVGNNGIESLKEHADEIDIVFEATSAGIHEQHAPVYEDLGLFAIDLTPAAVGPYVVPAVNFDEAYGDTQNINMVTCGGQATIPLVHAVDRVTDVEYGEMISTIASKSAGPGTRQNIDKFTQTTSSGLERVGGADEGKAIIVLNPAEPPIMMRNTVHTMVNESTSIEAVRDSVARIEAEIQTYVPGYQITIEPTVRDDENVGFDLDDSIVLTMTLEVEGEGQYLPPYAGNLDIMTSAALGAAERVAERSGDTGSLGGVADD
jgi:acetaldehyde dehydrogenase